MLGLFKFHMRMEYISFEERSEEADETFPTRLYITSWDDVMTIGSKRGRKL